MKNKDTEDLKNGVIGNKKGNLENDNISCRRAQNGSKTGGRFAKKRRFRDEYRIKSLSLFTIS